MTDLDRAIAFATEAHSGQVDKLGEPYIDHCLRVMDAVSEPAKRVAVLHDVAEDCGYSFGAILHATKIDSDEVLALDLLTRDWARWPAYADYIARIADPGRGYEAAAPIAREVKVADLRDNLGRWVPELGEDLKQRYERALERLTKEKTT